MALEDWRLRRDVYKEIGDRVNKFLESGDASEAFLLMADIAQVAHLDQEVAHIWADDVLCKVLRELGWGTMVDSYESFGKWYA